MKRIYELKPIIFPEGHPLAGGALLSPLPLEQYTQKIAAVIDTEEETILYTIEGPPEEIQKIEDILSEADNNTPCGRMIILPMLNGLQPE